METEQVEKNILIANRIPPSDRWRLVTNEPDGIIYTSLTDTLNAYFQQAIVKPQAFRLEPLKGKLYIITTEEIEIPKPEPKKYDLYGDFE
jgi:hypothetical protein